MRVDNRIWWCMLAAGLIPAMTAAQCPPVMGKVLVSGDITGFSAVLQIDPTTYGNISSPTLNPSPLVITIGGATAPLGGGNKRASITWTDAGPVGGSLLLESMVGTYDRCCKWWSIRPSGTAQIWVLGEPGTRYKLRRTVTSSNSSYVTPETPPGACGPDRRPTVWATRGGEVVGPGVEIVRGRTSQTTRTFGGKVYSLADTWSGYIETLIVEQYGWCSDFNQRAYMHYRLNINVEVLPPDPITFVLVIGARDGNFRLDLGAQRVGNAFLQFTNSVNDMSPVQVFSLLPQLSGPRGSVEPAIRSVLDGIKARAMPGDSLIVYVESHGGVAFDGDEPPVEFNPTPEWPASLQEWRGYSSTGHEYLYFHNVNWPNLRTLNPNDPLDRHTREELAAANAPIASEPDNLSDDQFAQLFRGGRLDCMNKTFLMGQCFAGGFIPSLISLPKTAVVAASSEASLSETMVMLGSGDKYGKLGVYLTDFLNQKFAEGASLQSINLVDLVYFLRHSTDVHPLFRANEGYPLSWPLWTNRLNGSLPAVGPVAISPSYGGAAMGKCIADLVGVGGNPIADASLTADDLIAYLDAYFSQNVAVADVAKLGGVAGHDGQVSADDLILFVQVFLNNCR